MNKDCVIVQYYIRDYNDEYILNKSIDSYKKLNLDIILISHSPIPEKIQKKVKYFLYDSDDELVTFEDAYYNTKVIIDTCKRFILGDKIVFPFLFIVDDLAYTFYKAVYNVYKFALNMGYENSYYFIGDSYINDKDVEKIYEIRDDTLCQNKFGYFEIYLQKDHLSPFFWFVNNRWFLENGFPNLETKETFFNCLETYCVYEKIIFDKIFKCKNDVILNYLNEIKVSFLDEERFDLSKKYSKKYDNDIGLFYEDEIPYIFSWNHSEKDFKNWRITIEYDDIIHKYDIAQNSGYWKTTRIKDINSSSFRIRCENMDDKKIIYDIFIDDIIKYKNTFKIKKLSE